MNYYLQYDYLGKIVSMGISSKIGEGSNELLNDSPIDISKFYIENDVLCKIPEKASDFLEFNYATKQWEDPRTLQDLKDAQWTLIKQARSQAEYAGFTWDTSIFDSDATSQNRITGAVTLAQMSPTFTIDWILADNTVRTLSATDMMQVAAALGQHVAAQFSHGAALRAQIEAALTQAEVEAVVW